MNTILKIISVILVILGVIALSISLPYQDGWYWFATIENETEIQRKYGARVSALGIALILAAAAIMKFAVDAE